MAVVGTSAPPLATTIIRVAVTTEEAVEVLLKTVVVLSTLAVTPLETTMAVAATIIDAGEVGHAIALVEPQKCRKSSFHRVCERRSSSEDWTTDSRTKISWRTSSSSVKSRRPRSFVTRSVDRAAASALLPTWTLM